MIFSWSRSHKIRLLSISKFFVYCCHGNIDFYLKLHFHTFQFVANYWWKFYIDRRRKKTLLGRLKNNNMASEKLYQKTLTVYYFWADFMSFNSELIIFAVFAQGISSYSPEFCLNYTSLIPHPSLCKRKIFRYNVILIRNTKIRPQTHWLYFAFS